MALVVNRAREQGSRAGPHHTSCASLPVLECIVSVHDLGAVVAPDYISFDDLGSPLLSRKEKERK